LSGRKKLTIFSAAALLRRDPCGTGDGGWISGVAVGFRRRVGDGGEPFLRFYFALAFPAHNVAGVPNSGGWKTFARSGGCVRYPIWRHDQSWSGMYYHGWMIRVNLVAISWGMCRFGGDIATLSWNPSGAPWQKAIHTDTIHRLVSAARRAGSHGVARAIMSIADLMPSTLHDAAWEP
jgi:hypothetical protein